MKRRVLLMAVCAIGSAQDAEDVCRRAVELHQSGDVNSAIPQYESCLTLRPGASQLRSNYGAALASLGRYQEAIQQYEKSLASGTKDTRLRFNLALAYYKSGDISKAARELTAVHEQQPQAMQVTLLLADCHLQLGNTQQVIDLLSPIEAEQKDNLAYSYMLGMALIRSGHVQKGQAVVDRILRDGNSAESHLLMAHTAFSKKDYPQAVKEFGKALELNPNLVSAQSFYGQSLLFTGDAEGAAAAFRKELQTNANDYESNVKLGSILSVRKQYAEAMPLLEHAAQLRPGAVEAHGELAAAYKALGRSAEAAKEESVWKALGGEPAGTPETGLLAVGAKAPEFTLPAHGTAGKLSLKNLVANGPAVLIFGSYTCPKFRASSEALNQLADKYSGRLPFVLIYIQEAHSEADWQSSINRREQISLAPAKTFAQKQSYAETCIRKLHIRYAAAVDDFERKAEKAYHAWPSAVYVVERAGTVLWASRLGEQEFSSSDLERALLAATAK